MITMIDDSVGRVMAALRETGQHDNTIVVFTRDHGDYMGDHGLLLKGPLHLEHAQSASRGTRVDRDGSRRYEPVAQLPGVNHSGVEQIRASRTNIVVL
jgi:hypothetical protein